jgi:hypothetical protein
MAERGGPAYGFRISLIRSRVDETLVRFTSPNIAATCCKHDLARFDQWPQEFACSEKVGAGLGGFMMRLQFDSLAVELLFMAYLRTKKETLVR